MSGQMTTADILIVETNGTLLIKETIEPLLIIETGGILPVLVDTTMNRIDLEGHDHCILCDR